MKKTYASFATLCLLSACTAETSDGTTADGDKSAFAAAGKADGARDWCGYYGWYGDGECDTFCLDRDSDCATDARAPELGDDLSVMRTSQITMGEALALAEAGGGATIEAKFELDHDGKLALSIYPLGASIALDAERNVFLESAGDPTAEQWQPGSETFHDQEHLTRSARDLTLVQLSRTTLREAVVEAEELGTVYWAIPTLQNHRAGYGVYVLDEDGDSFYAFLDGSGSVRRGVFDLGTGPGTRATDARSPELGDDLGVLRSSRISMSRALAQVEATYGPSIEAKFELDHDGKLSLSIYPVGAGIDVDAGRNQFFELAGDPTARRYAPTLTEFSVPDEEHLTRSARDLTIVQAARMPLIDAVRQVERLFPRGIVYWAIPTLRDTRAGYGIYVRAAGGSTHYLFVC